MAKGRRLRWHCRPSLIAAGVLWSALLHATPAKDEPAAAADFVIPAGQDALVARLLGEGKGLPGGCKLERGAIEQRMVVAQYRCDGERSLVLELRHRQAVLTAAMTTEQFAVTVRSGDAAALLEALAGLLRQEESAFQWFRLPPPVKPRAAPVELDAPPPSLAAIDDPKTADIFRHGIALHRAGDYQGALEVFVRLAKTKPKAILGHIVDSLARSGLTAQRAQDLRDDADLHREDPLKQFVAGVASHYAAHNNAVGEGGKPDLYRAALRYLDRAAPAFQSEPRLHIYLAVSHFRLGHQREAELAIEQAVAMGAEFDPDAFYCRAEIFQNKDLDRSIADLDRYIAMTDPKLSHGDAPSPSKQLRVRNMREHLLAVREKRAMPAELFDPGSVLHTLLAPGAFAAMVVGVGAFGWLGVGLLQRRRRR